MGDIVFITLMSSRVDEALHLLPCVIGALSILLRLFAMCSRFNAHLKESFNV